MPSFTRMLLGDEGEGALGHRQPFGPLEHASRRGRARRSSGRSSRPAPCRPSRGGCAWRAGQQLGAMAASFCSSSSVNGDRVNVRRLRMLWPSKLPAVGDVVDPQKSSSSPAGEHARDLLPATRRRTCLPRLRCRHRARRRSRRLGDHLALEPGDGLLDAQLEQRVARLAPGLGHQVDQQGVVVEHLLEVRHQPALVDRVAGEAAAEVIVDAALADVGQRVLDGGLGGGIVVADGAAPQQPEEAPLRELRRALQAAVRRRRR